jgi:endoglucanase
VIGLECSPRRPTARLGLGPVIRVGDKGSVFDPALTHHLQACAAVLDEALGGFPHQRALMDGGNCESTAYNLWDVPAGGLCLALANYHNVGPGGRLAPEAVSWTDLEGLVALMRQAARSWPPDPASARIRARLDGAWEREREALERSARRLRATTTRGGGA